MFHELTVLPANRLQGPPRKTIVPEAKAVLDVELGQRAARELGYQPQQVEATSPNAGLALAETLATIGCGTFTKDSVKKYMRRVVKNSVAANAAATQRLSTFELVRGDWSNLRFPLVWFLERWIVTTGSICWCAFAIALLGKFCIGTELPSWHWYPVGIISALTMLGIILSATLSGPDPQGVSQDSSPFFENAIVILVSVPYVLILVFTWARYANTHDQTAPALLKFLLSVIELGALCAAYLSRGELIAAWKAVWFTEERAESEIREMRAVLETNPKLKWQRSAIDGFRDNIPATIVKMALALLTVRPDAKFFVSYTMPDKVPVTIPLDPFLEIALDGQGTAERYFIAVWNEDGYRVTWNDHQ